jgi:uronate dehydrogenase
MKKYPKIIITGSEGSLGTILKNGLKNLSPLCVDTAPDADINLDLIKDYSDFLKVVDAGSIIVHLAWDMAEDFPDEHISPGNKSMAENVYKAAASRGSRRVIMASSVHANDYSRVKAGNYISPWSECFPDSPYGASKVYIEHLGRYYAKKYGLEVVCLRLGGVNNANEIRYKEDPLYDIVLLYKEDFVDLVRAAIDANEIPDKFSIIYGVSNVPGRVHDNINPFKWTPRSG